MTMPKRSTVYFDPELHRAVKRKAAELDASISDVVNEAVRRSLLEDAADLEAIEQRRGEASLDFEDVVVAMNSSGKI